MAFFTGSHSVSVDAKGRMPIPAAMRESIDPAQDGERFYLVPAEDGRPRLYPELWFRRLMQGFQRPKLPKKMDPGMSALLSSAVLIKPDGQGRVLLPEDEWFMQDLGKQVTLVGQYDFIALARTEDWRRERSKMPHQYAALLDQSMASGVLGSTDASPDRPEAEPAGAAQENTEA